jgi:hippurate hydrolase
MLTDGLFTRFPRPDFALSLHDDDTMPSGPSAITPVCSARCPSRGITVWARRARAAMPHNAVDPIVLASRIVLALQTIVARENNPSDRW